MSEKRADRDWVDARRADPASRYLLLVDLKLCVVSTPDRGGTSIRWFTASEIAALGIDPRMRTAGWGPATGSNENMDCIVRSPVQHYNQ